MRCLGIPPRLSCRARVWPRKGAARMSAGPVFTITYWGTTGTLSAPLKPRDVTAKFLAALRYLGERDLLRELAGVVHDQGRLEEFVERHLPLHLRSTYGGNTTCVEVQTP